MSILGIDLGSREVKIALMENKKIISKNKISTMSFYKHYCNYDGRLTVDTGKLGLSNVSVAVSTGYGKNNTDLNEFKSINEVKAHVYGALYQIGIRDFILLDVGGQDVKVARVEKGIITDLELNDKCAASCGRYLENMAYILEISLEEMFKHHENPVELNSTCAVFSESELIGKIAEGIGINRLCAGVNYSLYKRLKPLLTRFSGNVLVLSGGVAYNDALIENLKEIYKDVILLPDPQYNGAIGCCHYGDIVRSSK